ncbi:hypothetical protein N581_09740 [Lactobacillus jensenii MD IIE-70(2)]|nr:hypothetical protein N581_09740 [Lactobacillus jensenii MD IIE-70(2)]
MLDIFLNKIFEKYFLQKVIYKYAEMGFKIDDADDRFIYS